jgi:hypothetical protein
MENKAIKFEYKGEGYVITDDGSSNSGKVNFYCLETEEDYYFLGEFTAKNFDEAIETAKKMLDEHHIN